MASANRKSEDRRTFRHEDRVGASVAANSEGVEELSACVREAFGEFAGAAKQGLLALSVGVGLGVPHELMEARSMRLSARRAGMIRTGARCVMGTIAAR